MGRKGKIYCKESDCVHNTGRTSLTDKQAKVCGKRQSSSIWTVHNHAGKLCQYYGSKGIK